MPSDSKPLATLQALSFRGLRADGRPSRASGSNGAACGPMHSGLDAQANFGQGHGRSMFSTMPLMGHAMSGTQLGQADSLVAKARDTFARFAQGGKVEGDSSKASKPKGPTEKERREIRALIERGKDDAIASLRDTRAQLLQTMAPSAPDSVDSQLEDLSSRLALKDGGEVPALDEESPAALSQERQELMQALNDSSADPEFQMEMVDRLAEVERQLARMGIPIE